MTLPQQRYGRWRTAAFAVVLVAIPVVLFLARDVDRYPQGVPWTVVAPKTVSWNLNCRFAWVKLDVDPYLRSDYVNSLSRDGAGSLSGWLPGQDGRCTLTKTGGAGQARLTLVKAGVAHSQDTDTGRRPAFVAVH